MISDRSILSLDGLISIVVPNALYNVTSKISNKLFDFTWINPLVGLGKTIEINPTNESIDLSDINSGIYFLSVKTSKGIITKKIVRF